MRTLIIAWVITLGVLSGGAAWLQYAYNMQNPTETSATDSTTGDHEAVSADEDPSNQDITVSANDPVDSNTFEEEISTSPAENVPETSQRDSEVEEDSAENAAGQDQADNQNPSAPGTLTEEGPYGPIPVISNQRMPWVSYRQTFSSNSSRPRIAIIITGLGLRRDITENAIQSMPPGITFAFSPYGSDLQSYAGNSYRNGHEILMMLPMEPRDYPANDPGPHTLLTDLDAATNLDRLYWVLSRFLGYVGVISEMGSEFTASADDVGPIMQDLQRRGLLFVDSRATQFTVAASAASDLGMPFAVNDRYIDNSLNATDIRAHLQNLENVARATGVAVGVGQAIPVTMNTVTEWAATLAGKGIDLVPITSVVGRQTVN